ncbi:hypothetical protein HDU93_009173 [Gonapodya sp. JEL0774]|nr:hypothetical protein HDU93_009173 [Gonapodya sp. JEL0774]
MGNETALASIPSQGDVRGNLLRVSSDGTEPNSVKRGVRAFKNIPFAQAPIGNLRWRKPVTTPLPKWEGVVRDCTEYGPIAPQLSSPFADKISDAIGRERTNALFAEDNCLNLNVWTPEYSVIPSGGLPVMVWVHGGAFRDGSGASPIYDSAELVASSPEPLVVVTVNYRLNVFGFLSSSQLADEDSARGDDGQEGVGNWGLWDVIAAFEWVRNNISAFGGNPTNVTAFGESAGAIILHYITLFNPFPGQLFKRAIYQSGSAETAPPRPLSQKQQVFDLLCTTLSVPMEGRTASEILADLRAKSDKEIVEAVGKIEADPLTPGVMRSEPFLDGKLVTIDPRRAIREGKFDKSVKEMIFGDCDDEGTMFSQFFIGSLDRPGFEKMLSIFPPDVASLLLSVYLPAHIAEPKALDVLQAAADFAGDILFHGPVRVAARHAAQHGVKVRLYRWAHHWEKTKSWDWGVHHAVELPFIFQHHQYLNPSEREIAKTVLSLWSSFAASGEPGAVWPVYQGAGGPVLVLTEIGDIEEHHVVNIKSMKEDELKGREGGRGKALDVFATVNATIVGL